MRLQDLPETWDKTSHEPYTETEYRVRLSLSDAAKLAALHDMYPGRTIEALITDLLAASLDELEARFPYVPGRRVVAEDEQGDPIYEDIGLTPRFQRLSRHHLRQMRER